jgi:NAD+ kinase
MKVGLLTNPARPETSTLAEQIQASLDARGIESHQSTPEREEEDAHLPSDLDALITLGGDGTMLRAAHLHAGNGTPILGIHMGRLGFLAEVRQEAWEESLDRLCRGDYWLEERTMLSCHLHCGEETHGPWEALNEIVIQRSSSGRMIELSTYVDSGYFATYMADGLIVATATGSTAYALSAGGPILPPELPNMLLVPICPHLSFDRTIVLASGAAVRIENISRGEGAIVVDGVTQGMLAGDGHVDVAKSPHVTRFIRMYDRRQVYETLVERLQPRKVNRPDDGR